MPSVASMPESQALKHLHELAVPGAACSKMGIDINSRILYLSEECSPNRRTFAHGRQDRNYEHPTPTTEENDPP
jgi:hypothetical protein